MRYFNHLKGGLALLLLLFMSSSVWAFAGNVYVARSILSAAGVTVTGLYAGGRLNQTGGGAATTLASGVNYNFEVGPFDYSGTSCSRYTIFSSPNNPAFLLFERGAEYAIVSCPLGTTVPTNTLISSLRWYTKGQPIAPVISDVVAGYETARATLSYPLQFEYREARIRVLDADAGGAAVPATGGAAITTLTGAPPATFYNIGELVDGRVLATDADGHNYTFEIIGVVDGVLPSPAATRAFVTRSLAGAGSVTYDLVGAGLGLNQLSLPFVASRDGNPVDNVRQLVQQINAAAGDNAVTSVGWWDESAQIDRGYTITYPLAFSPVNAALADPADERIVLNRSYQVVVDRDVAGLTFTAR